MTRKWVIAAAVLVSVGMVAGCTKTSKQPVTTGTDSKAPLGDVAPAQEGSTETTGDVSMMPPTAPAPNLGGATGAGKIHVVQRGDTLFKLARQYYNDQSQWKRIYEANSSQIPNPNSLKVGQKLIIP